MDKDEKVLQFYGELFEASVKQNEKRQRRTEEIRNAERCCKQRQQRAFIKTLLECLAFWSIGFLFFLLWHFLGRV